MFLDSYKITLKQNELFLNVLWTGKEKEVWKHAKTHFLPGSPSRPPAGRPATSRGAARGSWQGLSPQWHRQVFHTGEKILEEKKRIYFKTNPIKRLRSPSSSNLFANFRFLLWEMFNGTSGQWKTKKNHNEVNAWCQRSVGASSDS